MADKQALLRELHHVLKLGGSLSADHQHMDRGEFVAIVTSGDLFLQAENDDVFSCQKKAIPSR